MTVSTDLLNAGIAALNDAADAYNGKKAEIDAKVASLIGSVSSALAKTIIIDPVLGVDGNDGTGANPVATFEGASALMINSGNYIVQLRGDCVIDSRVVLRGNVHIISDTLGVKRRISWSNQIDGVLTTAPSLRVISPIACLQFRDIIFDNVAAAAHVTYKRMIECEAFTVIFAWNCEFDTQPGDDLIFAGSNGPVALWMLSVIYPPEQAGLWLNNVGAGALPSSDDRIFATNLPSL